MESLTQLYRIGYGPSSSHTMGPYAASQYFLNLYPHATSYRVILYGSLALTGKGHLTDKTLKRAFRSKKLDIHFDFNTSCNHPNTMDFFAYHNEQEIGQERIYSVGGGKIKIKGKKSLENENIYPFSTFAEIKNYCQQKNLRLPEFVYQFESFQIKNDLKKVYQVMEKAIQRGLKKEGFLPGKLKVVRKAKHLYENIDKENEKQQRISAYAYAVSEENASGNLICTAPTCGAAGVLPAILYYYHHDKNYPLEKIIDALACAGVIGNLIKHNACISGAMAGCQSEIGSACSMAASAVAFLEGFHLEQIEYAAEIAMEHHLGLTCDPVLGLVQIPCIERNAVAALRAIDAAMLSKYLFGSRKISFDLVVQTMYETGKDLAKKYKETSIGGLAKNYHKKSI